MSFARIQGGAPNSDASYLLQNYAAQSAPPITNNINVGGAISSNRTVEYQQTNPTVNTHVLVCPHSDQRERYLKEGDILFINTDKRPKGPLAHRSRPPVDVANLQMINAEAARRQNNVGDGANEEEIKKYFKNWQFLGVIEAVTQVNGGCSTSTYRTRVDLMLSVQARGRSVRIQNHWPNSQPLDQLGFAVLAMEKCSASSAATHMACNFVPKFVVYGKDGFCQEEACKMSEEIVQNTGIGRGDLEKLLRSSDVQERRQGELAVRDAANKVRDDATYLMLPVNLTKDKTVLTDRSHVQYFGVMSDRFHEPAPSTSDVMPGLVNQDERMGHGGVCKRQCEVLINVA